MALFLLIRWKNLILGRAKRSGLVSILTSDTDYQLQLPCPEYLRLKRLQNSVRASAEVIQETLQKNHVRYKAAMVTLTYRDDVDWSPRQVSNYLKCVREWARRKAIFCIMCGFLN